MGRRVLETNWHYPVDELICLILKLYKMKKILYLIIILLFSIESKAQKTMNKTIRNMIGTEIQTKLKNKWW